MPYYCRGYLIFERMLIKDSIHEGTQATKPCLSHQLYPIMNENNLIENKSHSQLRQYPYGCINLGVALDNIY